MKPAISTTRPTSSNNATLDGERSSATSRRVALLAAAPKSARLPIWEAPQPQLSASPTSSEVLNVSAANRAASTSVDDSIIAIVMRPIADHETHQTGNDNRERELRCFLASLSPIEALTLRKRLDMDRSDDKVAVAFRRLLAERRQRLRAFLADPRRGRM